ncbi:MAG: DUF3943 domain-containing protein [Geobacteraceae bacterium]|nr:DUF3943 domain-containing protein [Geobacteraceae bacterium]NTW80164.1 DUF3943 domain-containing protein [Geobacteraceae bacterium]
MRILYVFSFISRRFGRTVSFASAVLLLLLAVNTDLSAGTLLSAGERVPRTSVLAGLSTPDGDYSNSVQEVISSKESLVRKAAFVNNSSSQNGAVVTAVDGTAVEESATSKKADGKRIPDWDGAQRDIGTIIGLQFLAVAITYVMPESFSSWTPEQKRSGLKKYSNNIGHPVMDKDESYINYGLHPYWGATYYIRARERGLDQTYSFIYSAALSALYEFGVEALAEKPSIQDLIATPVLGSLLGAYIVEPFRESIKSKQELRWYDHTALVLTDPLGVVCLGVEKVFGVKSTIMVDYSNPRMQNHSNGTTVASRGNRVGFVMQFPIN